MNDRDAKDLVQVDAFQVRFAVDCIQYPLLHAHLARLRSAQQRNRAIASLAEQVLREDAIGRVSGRGANPTTTPAPSHGLAQAPRPADTDLGLPSALDDELDALILGGRVSVG